MGLNIVTALSAYVSARMKADEAIDSAVKMARVAKLTKSTVHRIQTGSTAVSIDKLPGIAAALKLKTWELLREAENFVAGSSSFEPANSQSAGRQRLMNKVDEAVGAGVLFPQHFAMLEASIDSLLVKPKRIARDLPSFPPDKMLAAAAMKVAGDRNDAGAMARSVASFVEPTKAKKSRKRA